MLKAAPTPAADDWAEDQVVPWRKVTEEEYLTAWERHSLTAWVDDEGEKIGEFLQQRAPKVSNGAIQRGAVGFKHLRQHRVV
jgi:hypothetical protein